ncbi:PTS sugar transporter subunit IIA, partial [bacterium]|nr:PTS sugar transporter subunit IIA [bacterium]
VEVASTILLLTFAFDNINVMVMRESGLFNYRPRFRAPFYPFLQIAGIVALGFLIAEMGTVPILISVVSILAGFLWYSLYGRLKRARDSALARLIARITSSDLRGNLLETELREIIRERDGIVADRYDRLIETAPVLDIGEKIDMERFFRLVAHKIAPLVEQPPEEIFQLLLAREREATTVLHNGIAVPHIIIPGEKKFVILLARAREGIVFPSSEVPVKIAVVMAGTRDERTFYLRALAATVDALSSPDFGRRWLSAPNEFALKDAIIFARTKRFV